MTAHYERAGIRFEYPENWMLDEEEHPGGFSVAVEAPGGSFWSLRVENGTTPPAELVTAALDALRSEYNEIEVEEVAESVEGRELPGLDVSFFYLDLISTARIRTLSTPRRTLLVLFQAEDRELAELEPILRAITVGLLRAL